MPPFFYDIRYFLVIFVTIFEPLRNHFRTIKYPVNFRGIHFGYFRNQFGTIFKPQSIPNISSVHDQKPKITEPHLTEIAKSEKPRKYELRARAKNKYAKPCNKKTPRHRTTHKTRITSTCRPDKTSGLRPSTASAKRIKEQGRKPRDITSRVFFFGTIAAIAAPHQTVLPCRGIRRITSRSAEHSLRHYAATAYGHPSPPQLPCFVPTFVRPPRRPHTVRTCFTTYNRARRPKVIASDR